MTNTIPLAERLRPDTFDTFVGQGHLAGSSGIIRRLAEKKQLVSFVLWGPPGTGKTTLARIYANSLGAAFYEISAVSAGKAEVREIVQEDLGNRPKVLFIDEIHRFNKAQQDYLLPFVESGKLVFIGATTENPSFEVIPALLSRVRIFVLNALNDAELELILKRTGLSLSSDVRQYLIAFADGDARRMLGLLQTASELFKEVTVEKLQSVSLKTLKYDKDGEEHYNTVSAFIKSMRAGQGDAAIYYLARMLEGGEDPVFIARRMVVFASEDVGIAVPTALVVANAVFLAVQSVGLPESAINLAHGVAYLASCKKDRSAYDTLRGMQESVRKFGNLPIPMHLRNAPTKLMKELGYGKGYEMYSKESYLPEGM